MAHLDIKICGLKTADAVDAAIAGGASHLGFIFFAPSPRNIEPDMAAELAARARGKAACVAVTVNADDEMLDQIVETMRPGLLQLHGSEPPERVHELKQRHGLPVMKAFPVREAADLEAIKPYRGVADRMLFDAKPPKGADLPGGNGIAFDWPLLAGLDAGTGYMLSGGISAANVDQALSQAHPTGLDISSGVESAPGVKDIGLIEQFLSRVTELQGAAAE